MSLSGGMQKSLKAVFIRIAGSCAGMALCALVMLAGTAHGAETSGGQDIVTMDNMTINKISKEIRIKARLAIGEGLLEYLLVGEQGKTYESVFKVAGTKPSDLNFALLLIGCEPLKFDVFLKLAEEKDGLQKLLGEHKTSVVDMEISRQGKPVKLGELIRNRSGVDSAAFTWVYTGGYFLNDNRYVGDMELSHIGIFPDPSAVINLFSAQGNPYRGNFGFEMNKENAQMAVDQEFELVLKRRNP